jgi:hypothetical protein
MDGFEHSINIITFISETRAMTVLAVYLFQNQLPSNLDILVQSG